MTDEDDELVHAIELKLLTDKIAKLLRKETTLSMAGSQVIAKQIVTLIGEE